MFPFLQQSGMFSVDWRSKILQALSHVFTKERNILLSELHSYVLSSEDGAMELSDIQRLENKIQTQVGWIFFYSWIYYNLKGVKYHNILWKKFPTCISVSIVALASTNIQHSVIINKASLVDPRTHHITSTKSNCPHFCHIPFVWKKFHSAFSPREMHV